MTTAEKKSKRKGIIGTILFHAFLLAAFLFMGLTYQDPPPAEEGISINFGFIDEGFGEIEPKVCIPLFHQFELDFYRQSF